MENILDDVLGDRALQVYEERIKNKPLVITPTEGGALDARRRRQLARTTKRNARKSKARVKPLSAKEKRRSGVYSMEACEKIYTHFLPMTTLWATYMRAVVPQSELNKKNIAPALAAADYHGCIFTVTRSRCPSYIGRRGICLKETRNTFHLISSDNHISIIPKSQSVFQFEFDGKVFEIFGPNFLYRPVERSSKKFKSTPPIRKQRTLLLRVDDTV